MATITIRNLDDTVRDRLQVRAAQNGRSVEAEVRAILSEAVRVDNGITAWLDFAADFRVRFGGVDLPLPERAAEVRAIDLS